MSNIMLWAIISLLFLLWLVGVILKISAGGLVHIVLIVAVILLVINLLKEGDISLSSRRVSSKFKNSNLILLTDDI